MISLVIITFNQQEQLRHTLPMWLTQEDAVFDICVVDKNSEDDTVHMLEDMEEQYPNLHHVTIPRTAHGIDKDRLAVMLGIRGALCDQIILTRPQVVPPSPRWLSDITNVWSAEKTILLILEKNGKRLSLSRHLALFMARHGHARWALGQTIGYSRRFFMDNGGFPGNGNKKLSTFNALVRYFSKSHNTQIITDAEHTLHCMVP